MAQEPQTENNLEELENRLERLRVLYEQYFMGIEKREPGVQRKDVERRIAMLRKVRFQSTAMRFKFQTTVQRFNTLQQYWNRTCREIENGTYRRHVLRAERRLASNPPATSEEARDPATSRTETREKMTADLASMLDDDLDLDAEMKGALAALEQAPAPKPSASQPKNSLSALGKRAETERKPGSPTLTLGKAPTLKGLGEKRPSLDPRRSMSPKPKGLEPLQRPATQPGQTTSANPLAGLTKKSPSPTASPGAARGPAPLGAPRPKAGPPPAPSMRPQAARPAAAAPQAARPAAAAPQAARPAAPAPQAARTAATAAQTAAAREAGLSADRIRNIHKSYVEARKKTNASEVSFEKLERNIRETERKLREKHKGRNVDFDVSIKDGKAILKPRLK